MHTIIDKKKEELVVSFEVRCSCGRVMYLDIVDDKDDTYFLKCPNCKTSFHLTLNLTDEKYLQILKDEMLEYLQKEHPYPEDIFRNKVGEAVRLGYNSCMYNLGKFFVNRKELEENEG